MKRMPDPASSLALAWLVCALCAAAWAAPAELLTGFRQSSVRTDYCAASEVQFSSGLVELESGVLAHHLPRAMKEFRFAEPVWGSATRPICSTPAARVPVRTISAILFFQR